MMHRLFIKLSTTFIFFLLPALSHALPEDRRQPIEIEADHAQMDDRAGITQYKGNAVLTQGTLRIEGDIITFYYDDNRQLIKAVAEGHFAKYQQIQKPGETPIKAKALRMEYDARLQKVYLSGKGHVWQNGNDFRGEQIEYDIEKDIVNASGKQTLPGTSATKKERIHIIIQPPGKQKTTAMVRQSPSTPQARRHNTAPAANTAYPVAVITTHLNIRTGPGTQYKKLAVFQPGTEVYVLTAQKDWLQVRGAVNGQAIIGWVHRRFTRIISPKAR